MTVEKKIKFQFFRVKYHHGDDEPQRYDLAKWLDKIKDMSFEEKQIEIKGYPSRLETVRALENDHFVYLQFVKMTDTFVPSKALKDQNIKPIELGDNEYIATDVNVLYDIDSQTMLVQSNRGSLSSDRIADYINAFAYKHKIYDDKFGIVTLVPIYNNPDYAKVKKRYKQIEFTLEDTGYIEDGEGSIDAFSKTLKRLNGRKATITIGLGRAPKDARLNDAEIEKMISDLMNSPETKKAHIIYDDADDSYKYDLFEKNILTSYHIFQLEHKQALDGNIVCNVMQEMFNKNINIVRR